MYLKLLFCTYLHFEKGTTLQLKKKLESSSPKDPLCQVWLKLAPWFLRRRFLNFVNVFLLIRNYLPSEKGGTLHLNKLKSPSARDALPIFVEIGLLEKKSFVNVFFYFIIPILFFLLNLKKENYFSLEKVCVPFPTVNKTNGFTKKSKFFKNAKGTGFFFLDHPPPPDIARMLCV